MGEIAEQHFFFIGHCQLNKKIKILHAGSVPIPFFFFCHSNRWRACSTELPQRDMQHLFQHLVSSCATCYCPFQQLYIKIEEHWFRERHWGRDRRQRWKGSPSLWEWAGIRTSAGQSMSDVLGMKPDWDGLDMSGLPRCGVEYYGVEGRRDWKWRAGGLDDVQRFMDVVREEEADMKADNWLLTPLKVRAKS